MNNKYSEDSIKSYITRYFSQDLQHDETVAGAKERLRLETYLKDWARGKHLVKSVMGGMVEECINTPWSCSVQSEAYWSQ